MRIAVINQRLSLTSYIEGIGEMSHRFVPE